MTPLFKAPFRATLGSLALFVALGGVPAYAAPPPAHPTPHTAPLPSQPAQPAQPPGHPTPHGALPPAAPPAHPTPHSGPPPGGNGFAAQPRASQDNPTGRAHVDLTVAYANHSGSVDPRLAKLKAQVGSMGFTGFQVLSTHDGQLSAGQDFAVNVEGGQRVDLTLVSRTDAQVRVRIQISRNGQKVLDTTQSSPPDKTFTVGGTTYQDGKLFLLIKAD